MWAQSPTELPGSSDYTLISLVGLTLTSILAALLMYLKHLVMTALPNKDKEIQEKDKQFQAEVEKNRIRLDSEVDKNREREAKIRAEFDATVKLVIISCENERKDYRSEVERLRITTGQEIEKIRERSLLELEKLKEALLIHRKEITEIIKSQYRT